MKFTNHEKCATELQIDCFDRYLDLSGYRHVLVVVENTSLFIWARPLRTKRVDEVAKTMEEIFLSEGISPKVRCDNGSEFGKTVKTVIEEHEGWIIHITPRKSRSNVCTKPTNKKTEVE